LLEQGVIRGIRILIFSLSGTYFTGDGALNEVGYYRITGRVDDVVVSGHNLGTAPYEDAIEHPAVAKCYCWFSA
jgi:acyl-coenzyme A synthetase/AMP-(fatty) acid ligase